MRTGRLLTAGAAALLLAVGSALLTRVDLGPWNDAAVFLIAGAKALLVLFVFMEVGSARSSAQVAAAAALLLFLLLLGLSTLDVATRNTSAPQPLPRSGPIE